MKLIVSLLILAIALYCRCISSSKLKLVQIVHRHGDRTPYVFYPNDQYKNLSYWPDGEGQLNIKGKQRMYELGLRLRKDYSDFIGNPCNPREILIRSSASDRCIESASALISALCPPTGRWIWCNDATCNSITKYWQPISIQTVEKAKDKLLNPFADCKVGDEAVTEIVKSKEVQDYLKENKEFVDKVGEVTGSKKRFGETTTLWELMDIADTIMVERENGKDLTQFQKQFGKFESDVFEKLDEISLKAFKWEYSTKTVQRLRAGPLLGKLLYNIKNFQDGNEPRKLFFYSTHDSMLVAVLQALGIYNGKPPSYGEGIIFELHQTNLIPEYNLNITFIGHSDNEKVIYKQLKLPNCTSSLCTLQEFNSSISEFIPKDWDEECGNKKSSSSGGAVVSEKVGISIGIGVCVLISLIVLGFVFTAKNKKNKKNKRKSIEESRDSF